MSNAVTILPDDIPPTINNPVGEMPNMIEATKSTLQWESLIDILV